MSATIRKPGAAGAGGIGNVAAWAPALIMIAAAAMAAVRQELRIAEIPLGLSEGHRC
jgi:hypothetical protein